MNIVIKDVVELFARGYSANEISEVTNVTSTTFKNRIKRFGFQYKNNEWSHSGDNLNEVVAEVKDGITASNIDEIESYLNKKDVERDNKSKDDELLSESDIKTLKEIIKGYNERNYSPSGRPDVIDEMNRLGIGVLKNRKRQSYNISEEVKDKFEAYAKEMRLSQSDLIELAMVELLDKYS